MYVKYRPGESADQRQIVGSKEAAEIERTWKREGEVARDLRHAQYATDRAKIMLRLMTETFPPGLVMFYVRFVGPLRDGDVFDARFCHDKKVYRRVVDLQRRLIVAEVDWTRQCVSAAPTEVLIRPFLDGSAIDVVDQDSGRVARHVVRIPDGWESSWTIG